MNNIYIKLLTILVLNLPNQVLLANYLLDGKTDLTQNYDNSFDKNNKYMFLSDVEEFFKSTEQTLISDTSNKSKDEEDLLSNVEILSDSSSTKDNKILLEGNVLVKRNGLILSAEKLTYNQDSKTFLIEGNILFRTKDQFIIGTEIKYDTLERKGYVKDAYGSINLETIGLIDPIKNDNTNLTEADLKDTKINNVKFNSTSSIKLENIGCLLYTSDAADE